LDVISITGSGPGDIFGGKNSKALSWPQWIFASYDFVDDSDYEAVLSSSYSQAMLIVGNHAYNFAALKTTNFEKNHFSLYAMPLLLESI
jgi:hypothetical protein